MTKKKQNKTKKRKEKKKEKGENKRTWIEKRYCLFLACNHVTKRLCWWCVGGQYNRIVSRRSYLKIGSGSQKREMLLFLTLTHHHHGCRDVMCKPAGITGATLRGGDRRRGLGRGMNRKVIKWIIINFLLTGVLKHTKKGFPIYFRILCSWWGFLEYLGGGGPNLWATAEHKP